MNKKNTRLNVVFGAIAGGFVLASCGGGGGLADEAEAMADTQCACTTFDCTLEQTKWFNKNSIAQPEDIEALSTEDHARYKAAQTRSSDCQNELR